MTGTAATTADAAGPATVAGPAATGTTYPMRRWAFEDTPGRYDIDLGNSFAPVRDPAGLSAPASLALSYGSDVGSAELREQVARRYGGDPERVLVTHGAQEALFLLFSTLLRPGDQMIAFVPGWQSSVEVPAHRGCHVDALPYDAGMEVDVATVREVAGPRLRVVYVSSPNNPGGRRVSADRVAALAELAGRAGGYLVLDQEYEIDLSGSPALRHESVVSVSGLAKVYGLPGLRVGWLYGHPDVVAGCARLKHFTSIANSAICEALAAQVLADHDAYARDYHRLVEPGRALVVEWAQRHADQVRLVPPEGTPFAWLEPVSGEPSLALCRRALDAGVLLMPGETLGSGRGFRLGFARPPDVVAEGLRRLTPLLRAPLPAPLPA